MALAWLQKKIKEYLLSLNRMSRHKQMSIVCINWSFAIDEINAIEAILK